jgi:transposase
VDGAVVYDVPPKLVERSRRRRGIGKSDLIDAREIARATLREQARLVALRPTLPVIRDLKLLVEYHTQLQRERTQIANRLHADLVGLLPGYQTRARTLDTKRGLDAAELMLEGEPDSVHRSLAIGRLARVRELDRELRVAHKLIRSAVERSRTGLVGLPGIGPLTAARILAEVRDIRRFATPDAFARVNGTAPIPASSGQRDHHPLNTTMPALRPAMSERPLTSHTTRLDRIHIQVTPVGLRSSPRQAAECPSPRVR